MLLLVAACALIDADGRILMSQRPEGKDHTGLWEFPGGKIEQGERPENTIVRELREELGIEPCERCLQPFSFVSLLDLKVNILLFLHQSKLNRKHKFVTENKNKTFNISHIETIQIIGFN